MSEKSKEQVAYERELRSRSENIDGAMRALMSTKNGRLLVWDFTRHFNETRCFDPSKRKPGFAVDMGNPQMLPAAEGTRSALRAFDAMARKSAPEDYLIMLGEHALEEERK